MGRHFCSPEISQHVIFCHSNTTLVAALWINEKRHVIRGSQGGSPSNTRRHDFGVATTNERYYDTRYRDSSPRKKSTVNFHLPDDFVSGDSDCHHTPFGAFMA